MARGAVLQSAVWRTDLDRVDGFDASFSGWGREDSDLLIRLLHCGVRRKDGRFATGVIHLWHPEADRTRLPSMMRCSKRHSTADARGPNAACRRCGSASKPMPAAAVSKPDLDLPARPRIW